MMRGRRSCVLRDADQDAAERARLLNAADVAFLCLPDAASKEAAAMAAFCPAGPDPMTIMS